MTPEERKVKRRNLTVGWMAVLGVFIVGACCGSSVTFFSFLGPLMTR